jgi:hypothetical protein
LGRRNAESCSFRSRRKKPERAIRFYKEVLGWRIEKWKGPMDYCLIMTGKEKEPGIDGGLSIRTEARPSTVNTIDVASVDKYLKKIVDKGGKIVRPKMVVPGVGWMAYFKDPEGNTWGIMESDESAR